MDMIYAILLSGISSLWVCSSAMPPASSSPVTDGPATSALAGRAFPEGETGKGAVPARPPLRFDARPEGRPVVTCRSQSSGWSRTTLNGRVTAFNRDEPTISDTCNADEPIRPLGPPGARPRPKQAEGIRGESI